MIWEIIFDIIFEIIFEIMFEAFSKLSARSVDKDGTKRRNEKGEGEEKR